MPDRTAQIILSLQTQAAPQLAQLADGTRALTAAQIAQVTAAQRLATQTQQTAAAAQRLQTEEQRTAVQVANAARAQDQAALSALRLANAQNKAASGNSFAAQTADAFKGQLLGIVGPAAIATTALTALKGGFDLAQEGANVELLRTRFDSLAVSAGTTGEALIKALRAASGGEISDLNLTLAANKAQLLGVANSAEEFGVLMGIARDRAQQMGISTTQAFNDLTTGLGRGSALILDNLGIIVSVKEANEQYARSIGKTVSALTEAEQKQALINQVLAQGRASLDATGGAVDSNAGSFQRAGTALENFKNAFGAEMAARIGPTLGVLADVNDVWQEFIAGLNGSAQSSSNTAAATAAYAAEMERTGSVIQANAAYEAALSAAMQVTTDIEGLRAQRQASAAQQGQAAIAAQNTALAQGGGAYNAYAQAANAAAIANQLVANQIPFAQQAIDAQARSSVLATAQQQAQTAATDALKQETNAAATAFLNMNPGIDAAGIASQVAAGRVPALIGQLAALRLETDKTRGAMALLAAQQAGIAGVSKLFETGANNPTGAGAGLSRLGGGASGQLADQQSLQASRDQLALSRAQTSAQRIAIYERQLARQTTEEGRNRILAQIAQEKQGGSSRVGTAQTTALQLNQVEQDSGLQLARTQRENLERLRDQAEDFAVRRSRAEEDYAEKRRSLLARGQRAQADALTRDFEKDQRRAQEDFDRQNRRTLRNNAEATGDIDARTDARQQQIADRAALRGTPVSGARTSGGTVPPITSAAAAGGGVAPEQRLIQILLQLRMEMDSKQVGTLIYDGGLRAQIDQDLALAIAGVSPPGSVAQAVAGVD